MTYELIEIIVNEQVYFLSVQHKRMKNIVFRHAENNTFNVSAPYGTTPSKICESFIALYPRLLKLKNKPTIPFGDFTYLYGEEVSPVPATIEDFYKQHHNEFLAYITSRVRFFEGVMKIKKPYNVKVKLMSSRWGSNSKQTHSISFNYKLMHFSKEIIDALVVHELGHHYFRNHSDKYYNYLRSIIPNYDELDRKLMRYIYA